MLKLVMLHIAAVLLSLPLHAYGADEQGVFVTAGGIGEVPCVEFVSAMEGARRHPYRSAQYWTPIQPYLHYLTGYWSGFNQGWRGRQDVFEGWKVEDVLGRLEGICRERPTRQFYEAIVLLIATRK